MRSRIMFKAWQSGKLRDRNQRLILVTRFYFHNPISYSIRIYLFKIRISDLIISTPPLPPFFLSVIYFQNDCSTR